MADWADGSDLANMSRSGNVLQQMGYDPDEVRINPGLRADLMSRLASPMQSAPQQVAQNEPPPPIPSPNNRSQNGNSIAPAAPGAPRLFNRQQPSAPQLPIPATLGQSTQASMAGAAAPPTSAAVSPTGTTAPASNAPDVQNSRQAVGNLLAPEPAVPDTSAEDSMISAKSVPLNPRDPMYKEGLKGRIGRGFEAAGVGFMRGGVPAAVGGAVDPATVGVKPYGAGNSDYDIDDQTRQSQLALAEKQKADALAKFKTLVDLRKQQDTGSKDAGDISNNIAKLPNETTTANADMTRAQDAGQAKNENEALEKAYSATDPKEAAKYFAMAKAMHTATMQEKPPHDGPIPSAESEEFNSWKSAFQRDNKRAPTAAEIQGYRGGGKGDKGAPTKAGFEGLLKERDRDYQTQQKNYEEARKAAAGDDQAIAAADADNRNKLNDLQNGWNQRLADYDPDGSLSHAATPAAAATSQVAPATPTPAAPKVGDVKKGYRYTGGDPSNPASWAKVKGK